MTLLSRFARSESGLSAIEFAYILPVMTALLFGGIEITNALEVNKKVSLAAASVSDIVAQGKSLSTTQRDDIFSAADALMTPFDASQLTVVITSIVFNNNQAVVAWSEGHRKTPRAVNSVVLLPPGIIGTGTSLIMAEVTYKYNDVLGMLFPTGYNMADTFYDRPRRSVSVARAN